MDGSNIHLECKGTGAPTVILISGYRNDGEIWTTPPGQGLTPVFAAVAGFTRVCAYDRPSTILDATHVGRSDPVPMPRTAEDVVFELHDLLDAAGIAAPMCLSPIRWADCSRGSMPATIRTTSRASFWSMPGRKPCRNCSGQSSGRPIRRSPPCPRPVLNLDRDLEAIDFGAASQRMEEAAGHQPLYGIPLFVLSRGKPATLPPNVPANFSQGAFEAAWRKGQDQLASLLPDARHVIGTESDHYIQIEQPDLVIDAVRLVVNAVRDPNAWGAQ